MEEGGGQNGDVDVLPLEGEHQGGDALCHRHQPLVICREERLGQGDWSAVHGEQSKRRLPVNPGGSVRKKGKVKRTCVAKKAEITCSCADLRSGL